MAYFKIMANILFQNYIINHAELLGIDLPGQLVKVQGMKHPYQVCGGKAPGPKKHVSTL